MGLKALSVFTLRNPVSGNVSSTFADLGFSAEVVRIPFKIGARCLATVWLQLYGCNCMAASLWVSTYLDGDIRTERRL